MQKKLYIFVVFLIVSVASFGQGKLAIQAIYHYQNNDLDSAKLLIDQATELIPDDTAGLSRDKKMLHAQAWHFRGFIYKAIFKEREAGNPQSPSREEAVNAFVKSMVVDVEQEHLENNKKTIRYLADTYFNDAVNLLDTVSYEQSLKSYARYKATMEIIQQGYNFFQKDLEYYNALASTVYSVIYDADREANARFYDEALEAYGVVLGLDSNDYNANYNTAILYYNKGVNKIKSLDPDAGLLILNQTQDECAELFRKAEPYMLKAYELNPTRCETIFGLSGIYFGLNEIEKSNHYKELLKKICGEE